MLVVDLHQTYWNEITELVSIITLVSITSVALDLRQAITYEGHKQNKENAIITFQGYVRITLESCVRLTLGIYVTKLCNKIKKFGCNYVWKLRQDHVTKMAVELRQKILLD